MTAYRKTTIACLVLSSFSGLSATTIDINTTNFSATEAGGTVATSYFEAIHEGMEYIGSEDFLSVDATFELSFDYSGSDAGAAFWFGDADDAEWIFVNTDADAGSPITNLRQFSGRDLTVPSGGSATTLQTIPSGLTTSTTYTLLVDRSIVGSTINLDISLLQGASTVMSGSTSYTGPDASWGITAFTGNSGDTLNLTGLTVTTIPEPSTYAMVALMGGLVFLRTRLKRN